MRITHTHRRLDFKNNHSFIHSFIQWLPHDAIKARPMPSCGVCVSVCPSCSWILSKQTSPPPNCIKKQKKIKYGEKRFSIWQMELLHPAMWHDHDIYFAGWRNPAVWHMALESWQWIHQVAAPCNVAGGSRMTCHWIRQNVRHIGFLHLVSISTISPQSTCHSALCKILSKSDHPRQKKMTSCRFSRWWISAILDFKGPIMGSLKSLCTTSYGSSKRPYV